MVGLDGYFICIFFTPKSVFQLDNITVLQYHHSTVFKGALERETLSNISNTYFNKAGAKTVRDICK